MTPSSWRVDFSVSGGRSGRTSSSFRTWVWPEIGPLLTSKRAPLKTALRPHEAHDSLECRIAVDHLGNEVRHEEIRLPIRRVARHDFVGRDCDPFLVKPCVPAIIGMLAITGLYFELGFDGVASVAAKSRVMRTLGMAVVVRALQPAQEILDRTVRPHGFAFALRPCWHQVAIGPCLGQIEPDR